MIEVTIQRPDNRGPCAKGWVPLAWGVPVQVEDQGQTVQLTTTANTEAFVGCRVLMAGVGLLVVRVIKLDSGATVMVAVREELRNR